MVASGSKGFVQKLAGRPKSVGNGSLVGGESRAAVGRSLPLPAVSVSGRPRAATDSLLMSDALSVCCGHPEPAITGMVFSGRRRKLDAIEVWIMRV